MSDIQIEMPIQQTEVMVVTNAPQGEFAMVIRLFEKDLRNNGAVNLNELIEHVLDLESKYQEKITDKELAVLSSLSLLLGTSQRVIEAKTASEKSPARMESARIETIKAQQEITTAILSNLDGNGKPIPEVSKYYRLVTEVFEDYFNPESPKLNDLGVETEAGFYQGVLGMVTAAFLFKQAGYEVRMPEPQYDLRWDVDLLVQSQEGKLYAVDITARTPRPTEGGEVGNAFSLDDKSGYPGFLRERLGLSGFLRINVPPLTHHESNEFYEDRATGYPSESAKNRFTQRLGEILQQ